MNTSVLPNDNTILPNPLPLHWYQPKGDFKFLNINLWVFSLPSWLAGLLANSLTDWHLCLGIIHVSIINRNLFNSTQILQIKIQENKKGKNPTTTNEKYLGEGNINKHYCCQWNFLRKTTSVGWLLLATVLSTTHTTHIVVVIVVVVVIIIILVASSTAIIRRICSRSNKQHHRAFRQHHADSWAQMKLKLLPLV